MRHLATLSGTRKLIFILDALTNSSSDAQTAELRRHDEATKISASGRLADLKTKSERLKTRDLHENPSP